MRDEYDFSKAKKRKKVVKNGKKAIFIRLDIKALLWLEEQAEKEGIGYQTFLNNFLLEQWEKENASDQGLIDDLQLAEKAIKRIKRKVSA